MWLKASAVLPPWVALLLVAGIAWQSANIFWLLFPSGEEPAPLPVTSFASVPVPTGDSAGMNTQSIIDAHLFGAFDSTQAVVDVDPVDAPETRLNLELRGTIAATDDEVAMAIIAEASGDEMLYAIGDAVPGGVTLHSVHPDRVLLRRGPQLETLKLPRADETSANATRPTPPRRTTRTQSGAGSLREVISRDPARLTDVIRPQPVFRDGKQKGYRVYPGRKRQQFAALGLRPGDMITQINGMSLDDPARGMEVFRSLGDATQVSVTVERNGQAQVMTLDTSQLKNLQPGESPDDAKAQ